jgi:ATP-dependent helicase/nuclease subunit B
VSKEIWLGPLLGNNRSRLIDRCAELVSKGQAESFLYLAASHPLLELVTQGLLDGPHNRGVWGELPVYLFRGFVQRILSTAADEQTGAVLTPRIPIDGEELPLKRSLISQILKRLAAAEKLKAIAPLVHRAGCVNTVAMLIGEIQRAGKTSVQFDEVIASRAKDFQEQQGSGPGAGHEGPPLQNPLQTSLQPPFQTSTQPIPLQIDFDRDLALIYSSYCKALNCHGLTEGDADQLSALAILRGDVDGRTVKVPWLSNIRLLVLDGFFDFTPVQGEMLRSLIPQVPEVIVNLNNDQENPEIFRAFRTTLDQLTGMAMFDSKHSQEITRTHGALSGLRKNLFNTSNLPVAAPDEQQNSTAPQRDIRLLVCADRENEIRKIAKEIKRLVLTEGYQLADIALVVRERASYAEMIARVMLDEAIPCNLERRIEASEIAAVRAARKLFEMLDELGRAERSSVKVSDLADLIKSEYFRINESELATLGEAFEQKYSELLTSNEGSGSAAIDGEHRERLKYRLGVSRWDPDCLENTIAYVGDELSVTGWLERARKLLAHWPQVEVTTHLVIPETSNGDPGDEETEEIEDADKVGMDDKGVEKKRRPSRDVHPAAIAWASLVIECLAELIKSVPHEGTPQELRSNLMKLLDELQFSTQIRKRARRSHDESELPHIMLDLRGLEALRRAFAAAARSIKIATILIPNRVDPQPTRLTTFLDEVTRGLDLQVRIGSNADRRGLRVLEATDVRGLRFRAVFIAGLVEGGFPLRVSRDWIYPHEERERLKDHGLTLEDISPATLLKEEHYFYQAVCRASEKLYLSRPLLLDDATETVASYYIEELARAIGPFELKGESVRPDFDGKEILDASTVSELTMSLVRQNERHRHKAGRDNLWPKAAIEKVRSWVVDSGYLTPSAQHRIDIERERASSLFGPYDGRITTPELLAMLRERFGPDSVHSASGLSTYGSCPYRFFANRVLRLEPRGEAALDLQAIDAGKLLHDILRRFFERHRGAQLTALDRDRLRQELAEIADQVFNEHQDAVPPLNPQIWKIDREIRKIILDQVLIYELSVQEKTRADVRPAHFEVAFGMPPRQPGDPISKIEPLELKRSTALDEEPIKIQGQIDRVDSAEDGTLIAYDYKLSTGADAKDMKAGRSLQLPIYIEALERLILPGHEIAGGGYYILKTKPGRRNSGIYRRDASDYLGLQARNSIFSDYEWQKTRDEVIAKIWEFLDGMRAGSFVVTPSQGYKTCKFCDYTAVCRYDKYRIERKK